MEKILVSSCLLGKHVRYDGGHNLDLHRQGAALLIQWQQQGRIVEVCPECLGGLPTPRPPAERVGKRILTSDGSDVTSAFTLGANQTLRIARREQIKVAILKSRSPSCGNQQIYDGRFSGTLIFGEGLTAHTLRAHGIKVFNELQLLDAADFLESNFSTTIS